ncbi:Galectin [Sergentomyia squamirostris]
MNIRRRIERKINKLLMATIPVYNPVSPFLGLIPGGLRVGQMIRVKGIINYHGNRFQINIQTGPALRPRDDVGIHLSVRPHDHTVVRNTMVNNIWQTEERHGGCPLRPGQSFDILILAEYSCYKVAINGAHFCAFNHRMSLARMQYISIDGEVTVQSITQEGDTSGHVPIMPVHAVPANAVPVYPPMPYGATGGSSYPSAPTPPPPPPYSPYPQGPQVYGQPGVIYPPYQPMSRSVASPGPAYMSPNQPFQKKKSNKALKYAAGAAGVGAGIGLTALAISSLAGGGGGGDDDDGGDIDF